MPHDSKHDSDFAGYAKDRRETLRNIRELRAYLAQLEQVVQKMPAEGADAGYMDLDNIEQLHGDIQSAKETICSDADWDSLSLEMSRLNLL